MITINPPQFTRNSNSLSFEGRGKMTLEYREVPADEFKITLPNGLDAKKTGIKSTLNEARKQIIQKLVDAKQLIQEGTKLFLPDIVTKVIIEDGDDEIPDEINYPDVEIEMRGGETKTIKGSTVKLSGKSKVENTEAKYTIIGADKAEITGDAKAGEIISLSKQSKAKNVWTKNLILLNKAEITGKACANSVHMRSSSKAKDVEAQTLKLGDIADITGTVKADYDLIDYRFREWRQAHPVPRNT